MAIHPAVDPKQDQWTFCLVTHEGTLPLGMLVNDFLIEAIMAFMAELLWHKRQENCSTQHCYWSVMIRWRNSETGKQTYREYRWGRELRMRWNVCKHLEMKAKTIAYAWIWWSGSCMGTMRQSALHSRPRHLCFLGVFFLQFSIMKTFLPAFGNSYLVCYIPRWRYAKIQSWIWNLFTPDFPEIQL
jgi:hypothetical protein